jgi:surface polysaccharide O-acyltransferase-like enzyme
MKRHRQSNPIQRYDTIDLLRGLSVLSVVYLHITTAYFFLPGRIPFRSGYEQRQAIIFGSAFPASLPYLAS